MRKQNGGLRFQKLKALRNKTKAKKNRPGTGLVKNDHSLKIGSYNVDGLEEDRMYTLRQILDEQNLDILAIQETKIRKETHTNIEISGYSCVRAERGGTDKGDGGALYVYQVRSKSSQLGALSSGHTQVLFK